MPYYWERDKHLVYNRVPKFCSTSWSGVGVGVGGQIKSSMEVEWSSSED
jgi:hypothetical protein